MTSYLLNPKNHAAVWRIAWPLMLSNIAVPLLGIVDTAVLGHLDSSRYIGAAAVGGNVFTFLLWAFAFLRVGTTGLSAQQFGAQNLAGSLDTLKQACSLAVIISVAVLVSQSWVFPFSIDLIGGSVEVKEASLIYCETRVWGVPAALIQLALAGWMIGTQQSKALMWVIVSVNITNMLLDIVFVIFLGLDIKGVAIATVFSEYLGLGFSVYLIARYLRPRMPGVLRSKRRNAPVKVFLQVNRDIFIRTCLLLFVFGFFTAQGARQGNDVLAANAILISFLLLIASALDGFANAAEAKAGENTGLSNQMPHSELMTRFHGTNIIAGIWSALFSIVLVFSFGTFGSVFITTLTDLPSVGDIANKYLHWLVLMPAVTFLSFLLDGVFVGTTKTKDMRNIMFVCLFLVFFPIWYLSQSWGNQGLWLSLTAFMLARSVLMMHRYVVISRSGAWFA